MRVEFKLLIFSLMVMFLTSTVFSQNSENVVAEFSGHEITLGEFEKAYAKNVGGSEMAVKDSLQDYKNFLDLYVVYKMKLRDAYVRDYRNDEDLTNELDDYKEKVGVSYIQEKKIVSPGMKRFYDERGEEVRVSHIMFKKGADSDESLKQAEAILDSIKNGKTFEEMVPIYSQDNFSKNKGGDIYWFTAGQIVPAFEEGAYSTKVGEIYQKIITTKHGFHIIKVTDRAKRKYKIRAKHILVKSAEQENNMVDALPGEKPLAKATRIYEEVMNGADFDSLARKYSDDPGSGAKGGDLGLFGRRQMVQPFDEAVFALEVNEVSKLVKTRFGYHIIKLTEVLEYPTFENEIENLRDVYKKSRYQYDYDKYISGVKEECKFNLNKDILSTLGEKDSEITLSADYTENEKYLSLKDSDLISIDSDKYSVELFFEYLSLQRKYENKPLTESVLSSGANEYSNELLLRKKGRELEKSDDEFASLMKDYKNGIYIFKLQEDEVWNRVAIDSIKLREEYNRTKDNFTVEGKVNFNEIFSRDRDKIASYYQMLKNGVNFDSVAYKYTERPGFKSKFGRHGFKNVSDSELSKKANSLTNASDFSDIFDVDGGWSVVILRKKLTPGVKSYEEALPELSSAFQESESKRLEKSYVDGLNKLYQPEYFYDELENAYKAEEK